jgi:hypothetical protein
MGDYLPPLFDFFLLFIINNVASPITANKTAPPTIKPAENLSLELLISGSLLLSIFSNFSNFLNNSACLWELSTSLLLFILLKIFIELFC